ncbi:MAG: MmcQ/YjbR family DNA-binding protein, partial [Bacilli bacterium]|nr:MmcQ/YjbR family DNA-binding protein [Bacilli bacterium]
KRTKIIFEKLISYGFKKERENYIYSKNILNDTFRVDIKITQNGIVQGSIYDLSFECVYTNYRNHNQVGEFVSKVREEFTSILLDIKNKCTSTSNFIFDQTNRMAKLITDKYGDSPEFMWEKFPNFGVFKNSRNAKWYAAIMNIDNSKLGNESREVEIINVKLSESKIKDLLNKKGFYKAYHMNKTNWITIILDDTISDEEIMGYVTESHKYTEISDTWLIPANPKFFDIIDYFNKYDTIDWKQPNNAKKGDTVYIYLGVPYRAIMYRCEVLEINIPANYKDENLAMNKVMNLKLIAKYNEDEYSIDKLTNYGIKSVRGPRHMPEDLIADMH